MLTILLFMRRRSVTALAHGRVVAEY